MKKIKIVKKITISMSLILLAIIIILSLDAEPVLKIQYVQNGKMNSITCKQSMLHHQLMELDHRTYLDTTLHIVKISYQN